MTDHDSLRELAAGYVLGALDPDDRRAFETHLQGCEECRREVGSLAPLPGLLARAAPGDAEPMPAGVADRAVAAARSQWAGLARSRRAWRMGAVAAAVAAIVIAVAAILPGSGASGATALAVQPGDVTGAVTIEGRAWGTAVHFELANLPQREAYVAWVVDGEGTRQQCAAWGPTAAGVARLDGASSIPFERVTAVVITSADGSETLLTALAG
jgi:anti-sigma-K factor RskA